MTEIPEDVMKAADEAYGDAVRGGHDTRSYESRIIVIARAILAERERCCYFLRRLHEQQDGETFDTTFLDIEEIIRKGA